MRSYQVFAGLAPQHAEQMLTRLAEKAPAMFVQALAAASAALKARPIYLQRQPFAKRAEAVRRTLSRVATNAIADEVLAVYFLECRKELLVEWLDLTGVKHKDGTLEADAPPPPAEKKLREAVERFRAAGEDPDRDLLMRAFAAQDAVEWPVLEALLASPEAAAAPAKSAPAKAKPAPRKARKPR
ncbi:MAG: hypothetical protein ACHQ3O_07180 [Candidatus Limnocylindria bacterium]|jgi:hypothetical protein